jgi:citrate lyase subunit alpha/citrate CoA-transferase
VVPVRVLSLTRDVVVTERGIAVNPCPGDLLDAVKGTGLPIRDIRDIQREVEQTCGGKPAPPRRAARSSPPSSGWTGTVLDSVWKVER